MEEKDLKITGHRETGSIAVEMALLVPFLVVLALGVIEISVLMHNKAVITNASRDGARYGVAAIGGPYSDDEIRLWVNAYVSNRLISFAPATPTTTITRAGVAQGSPLKVEVSYPYSFLAFPNFVPGLGSSLTLGAETTMRME